ncbi:MAG: hypothetical protein QXF44_02110 [Candidatus Bathyarchaeia archaeon]
MLEIYMFTLWGCLALYTTWYFTSAKHYAPLTPTEAKILWKIHKQNLRCNGRKWHQIKRGGKIVGFACECGYKHIQKRPIVASQPTPNIEEAKTILSKLHNT